MKKQAKKGFIRRIPSIIGIIICIILAPVVIMNLTIVIKSYVNPNIVPDFFGIKPFVVVTNSMEPEIYGGDLVVTKTVDPSKLKINDIISFKDGNSVVTHRITELTEKDGEPAFITKGDANNANDENPVIYSQVEGICLFKIGIIGNIAIFMQTPVGMLVFVGIPACGFIIYDIIRRKYSDQNTHAEMERLRTELAAKESNSD